MSTAETRPVEITPELALRMYEQMRTHPDVRGARERALPRVPRCRVWRISTSARRRSRSGSARRSGATTTSRARTAATATAWRRGRTVERMFCELLGKEEGYCRGKGGSMHIADHETRQSRRERDRRRLGRDRDRRCLLRAGARAADQVAVCFFGEGALGQGVLYEVMNMASLWKLPVVYVCENNLYNEYTHYSETTAGDISARAAAFGIPSRRSTARTFARSTRRLPAPSSAARARRRARRSSSAIRTAITATTSVTSTAPTTDRRKRRSAGRRARPAEAAQPIGSLPTAVDEAELDEIRRAVGERGRRSGRASRSRRRIPIRAR